MRQRAKTIQIFLPSGDPQGIRIAEITTRIMQVIEVPRSLLGEFAQMPESGQVGLYFLIGESEGTSASVYIGQTRNLQSRLVAHHREKEFWDKAMVVVSRTHSLLQTHVLFLEWYCIQKAREVERYSDLNGNAGSEPYTPAPLQADCLEMFDTASILLSTLGFPIFEPIARSTNAEDNLLFYCERGGIRGIGQYTPEGMVVLTGSTGRSALSSPLLGSATERRRVDLLRSGMYRVDGERIVVEKDHVFSSPSSAASFLTGNSSSGWEEWKDERGRTLDEVLRQDTNALPNATVKP